MQPASHPHSHWLSLLDDYEKDQARIAQKLHDGIGQEIVVLSLGLKALEAATSPDKKTEILAELLGAIDLIGREVHSLSLDLHPASLDKHGLSKALAHYVSHWAKKTGINATFHDARSQVARLHPRVEATAYRVAREALANIAEHSGAKSANITLTQINGHVRLLIEDDGGGFDVRQVSDSRRRGIARMRDLMRAADGELTLSSQPSAGCAVAASFRSCNDEHQAESATLSGRQ